MSLYDMSPEELKELTEKVAKDYEDLKAKGLKLDITRGKPSAEQLGLAEDLLELPGRHNYTDSLGNDLRNYGIAEGIIDMRELWANVLGFDVRNVLAADSSSLNIEFDLISWAYSFGTNDSATPWSQVEGRKWICPVPGYDRHHTITEKFGFEMIPVPMLDDGPDVAAIQELVKDPEVLGMWAVPVFSNPTGVTFSEEVVRALAEMETAAPDFRIMWDNAYAVHTLTDEFPENYNVLTMSEAAGNPNRFWVLSSTSKITHAGSGVAFFASSLANLEWYLQIAGVRGIGPNKINQLAHKEYFGSAQGLKAIMRRHASILAPRFEVVLRILNERLSEFDVARWTKPQGGYFISLDVVDGTASRVWQLAKDAGIVLTKAGSSFPLGDDPNDRNIRLAPSLPPVSDLEVAMEGVATCVLYAAIEKLNAA
ncbi:aminotransferase class I/II-fold pyridoxal phosphate-dependent enzyme [Corynebacterium incognita]|uniref:Aminotransferase class I/II-fold pyridoxal phosphate-dependent enzyme n=1 Tax=Corynebacterium incognita TaxID=2754725 RepID=A0A7G7CMC5_9CORY|nr:aminotransferase class I/II-fold pyridoxal phosphate-dependent enzyme [Corynebacterium incognita]QNE88741.1 aminotransferase class I/II-fold pyridoxal phosphate-dependent enzyme [Corynebacterium incognita]